MAPVCSPWPAKPLIANETNHFRGTDTPGAAGAPNPSMNLISPDDIFRQAPWRPGPRSRPDKPMLPSAGGISHPGGAPYSTNRPHRTSRSTLEVGTRRPAAAHRLLALGTRQMRKGIHGAGRDTNPVPKPCPSIAYQIGQLRLPGDTDPPLLACKPRTVSPEPAQSPLIDLVVRLSLLLFRM